MIEARRGGGKCWYGVRECKSGSSGIKVKLIGAPQPQQLWRPLSNNYCFSFKKLQNSHMLNFVVKKDISQMSTATKAQKL